MQREIVVLKDEIEKLKEQQRELKSTLISNKDELNRKTEDVNELQRIMNRYGNNAEGMTALHYAIKEGDLYAVELMIAK